jgi:hypothetical protein
VDSIAAVFGSSADPAGIGVFHTEVMENGRVEVPARLTGGVTGGLDDDGGAMVGVAVPLGESVDAGVGLAVAERVGVGVAVGLAVGFTVGLVAGATRGRRFCAETTFVAVAVHPAARQVMHMAATPMDQRFAAVVPGRRAGMRNLVNH